MRFPRFTIAKLMLLVLVVALLMGFVASFSIVGLIAFVPFTITVMISRLAGSRRDELSALAVGIVGTLAIPFVLAIWINNIIWGYHISRPPVDSRIVDASEIERISYVEPRGRVDFSFAGTPIGDPSRYVWSHPQEGDYYVLEGRVLRDLIARGQDFSRVEPLAQSKLDGLYELLENTGRLDPGEPAYKDAKSLRGIVIEALDRDHRPLMFVAVASGEISNDHHAFYEFLFSREPDRATWKLISFQRFYYDAAGMEGVEWPSFFVVFSVLSLLPTIFFQAPITLRGTGRVKARLSLDPPIDTASFPASMAPPADFLKTRKLDCPG